MKSNSITRVALLVVGGLLFAGTAGLTFNSVEACGESGACSQLRETEFANLLTWQACDPDLYSTDPIAWLNQCTLVGGNTKDCTGVLSCGVIPINAHYRTDAEHAVLVSGQQSQGCFLCATPDCITGTYSLCEPVSRRCQAYQNGADAGIPVGPGDDGGGIQNGNDAATSGDSGTDAGLDAGSDAGVPPGIDAGTDAADAASE